MFSRKQTKLDTEGYKLKHGRGLEVNDDLFNDDDLTGHRAYKTAGVAVNKEAYNSEMPKTKSTKMLYSSVGDEERRRAAAIKNERDNLDYQQFTGNDVTQTMNDVDGPTTDVHDTLTPYQKARNGGKVAPYAAIGQQTTMQDDGANPYNMDGDDLAFENEKGATGELRTLRIKGPSEAFDGIVGSRRRPSEDSDAAYGIPKENYNFASAPQNAKSALVANPGLKERYDQF